jgi:hypothetical protein
VAVDSEFIRSETREVEQVALGSMVASEVAAVFDGGRLNFLGRILKRLGATVDDGSDSSSEEASSDNPQRPSTERVPSGVVERLIRENVHLAPRPASSVVDGSIEATDGYEIVVDSEAIISAYDAYGAVEVEAVEEPEVETVERTIAYRYLNYIPVGIQAPVIITKLRLDLGLAYNMGYVDYSSDWAFGNGARFPSGAIALTYGRKNRIGVEASRSFATSNMELSVAGDRSWTFTNLGLRIGRGFDITDIIEAELTAVLLKPSIKVDGNQQTGSALEYGARLHLSVRPWNKFSFYTELGTQTVGGDFAGANYLGLGGSLHY